MLFNSYEFAVFFLLVAAVYYALPSWSARKAVVIAASYLFYGAWNPPYVLLLIGTTGLDYLIARRMDPICDPSARKAWATLSVCLNLGVLAFFKFGDFLIDNANTMLKAASLPAIPHYSTGLLVPIGLSFYTFQSIAYVIDVYRREIPAVKSWSNYMAFVSFFPLLAAGPIMRARDLIAQFATPRVPPDRPLIGAGFYLIVLGLFQKVVMADNVAPLVNAVFKAPSAHSTLDLWAAVYAFAFQIYFDFAGYSNMAMGLAMLLGFKIPRNFAMPYIAAGFSEFWRRWHITLSQWLRDYLYIPLGGNRSGPVATYWNLMATMLLGGLWHGASWTFVIWGGLHGLYLCAERAARGLRLPLSISVSPIMSGLGRLSAMFVTFHLVCVAWILFRAEGGVGQALLILSKMLRYDAAPITPAISGHIPIVAGSFVFLFAAWILAASRLEIQAGPRCKAILAGLMMAALTLIPGNSNAFIYFQF